MTQRRQWRTSLIRSIWLLLDTGPGRTNGRPPATPAVCRPSPWSRLPGKNARRLDRETWHTIAEGRARVIFLRDGEFDELRAAYAMSDEDLWQTLAKHDGADLG